MGSTKIEWTDYSWNPIRTIHGGYHCTKVSAGCQNCYAEKINMRFGDGVKFHKLLNPVEFCINKKQIEKPLHWRKPRRIFVQSMGDLFHEDIPFSFIANVFYIIHMASQHTYMVLTKRPERMKEFIEGFAGPKRLQDWAYEYPNVWLGVTAENQKMADERIPILLQIPAAKRFVSVEPMLGPTNLAHIDAEMAGHKNMYFINALNGRHDDMGRPCNELNKLDWVICGGETGPGARPMHPDWVRSLRDQCQAAGTPFFFKSWGNYCAPSQMPESTYRAWDYHHGTETCWREDDPTPWKVGKKAAGRQLDGKEWNEYPREARSANEAIY
jgi:protein gp37